MSKINNYCLKTVKTERIQTAYYRIGEEGRTKILVLHGNISSSVFFMPLAPFLEQDYDIVVPDLRGFGMTQPLPVDATRGYRDWSDDVYELCKALGWERFVILGWSMGGDIAMQFAIDHTEMVEKMILVAPGSPYGFGGTKDEKGTMHSPPGLGSGGGCANPALVVAGKMWNNALLKDMLNRYLFKEPFRLSKEWEERFVEASAAMQIGTDFYPGDYSFSWRWPYLVAGDRGILNTMSPVHGNLNAFLEIDPKPDILWIRGDADQIVSDESMMELGYLGKIGIIPGWPGNTVYPPQPMVKQTRYFLEQYREKGGNYAELVIPGGHVCILESPMHFVSALKAFLPEKKQNKKTGKRSNKKDEGEKK